MSFLVSFFKQVFFPVQHRIMEETKQQIHIQLYMEGQLLSNLLLSTPLSTRDVVQNVATRLKLDSKQLCIEDESGNILKASSVLPWCPKSYYSSESASSTIQSVKLFVYQTKEANLVQEASQSPLLIDPVHDTIPPVAMGPLVQILRAQSKP